MRLRKRGIALVTTFLLMPVMVVLCFCLTTLSIHNLSLSQNMSDSKKVEYVAEAGAFNALEALKSDKNFGKPQLSYTHQMPAGGVAETANVTVYNNKDGTGPGLAANGAAVPSGCGYILSISQSQDQKVRRSVGVLVRLQTPSPFNMAAFGVDSVKLGGGATIDSYNSAVGVYAVSKQLTGGDIGTNAIASGAINLVGSTTKVLGKVNVGLGGNGATISTSGGASYLTFGVLGAVIPTPSVVIPALGVSNGSYQGQGKTLVPGTYGDYKITGGTLQLAAGTYVFDSLTLTGRGTVNIVGTYQTVIYVTGNTGGGLDLTGNGATNPSGNANNLLIYAGPNVSSVKVAGNSLAAFGLYAPNSDITINGGSDIFGSLIGKTVTNQGGTALHYDSSLNQPPPTPPTVSYWQRF